MKTFKADDVPVILDDFGFLGEEKKYGQIGWAYVTKGVGVLSSIRAKKSDPLRKGQLTLPAGHKKRFESPLRNARRETYEETGVFTWPGVGKNKLEGIYEKSILIPDEKIVTILQPDGRVWMNYIDSKKWYTGFLISDLYPLSKPSEKEADNLDPKYVPIEMFMDGNRFLPSQQVYAELIGVKDFGRDLKTKGCFYIDENDMSKYLEMKEPEYQTFADFLKPILID